MFECCSFCCVQAVQSPSGGPTLLVSDGTPSNGTKESIRCDCHVKVVDHTTRKAVIKLVIASIIALVFMIGEVVGKWEIVCTGSPLSFEPCCYTKMVMYLTYDIVCLYLQCVCLDLSLRWLLV